MAETFTARRDPLLHRLPVISHFRKSMGLQRGMLVTGIVLTAAFLLTAALAPLLSPYGFAERFERTWTPGHENINLQSHEFRGQRSESIGPATGVSGFENDVPSVDIAQIAQPPYKAVRRRIVRCRAAYEQHADTRHTRGGLSPKVRTTEDQGSQDGKAEDDT